MPEALVVIIPILFFCVFLACLLWGISVGEKRLKRFAAAEGIAYKGYGEAPIAVPQVVYDRRRLNEMSTFLYGPRHGVQVFACHFRIGSMRGSVEWLQMVAVHAELHDVSGLDTKRWTVTPLNGWTFLIPTEPKGGTLKTREITALWDALTAAVQRESLKAIATV